MNKDEKNATLALKHFTFTSFYYISKEPRKLCVINPQTCIMESFRFTANHQNNSWISKQFSCDFFSSSFCSVAFHFIFIPSCLCCRLMWFFGNRHWIEFHLFEMKILHFCIVMSNTFFFVILFFAAAVIGMGNRHETGEKKTKPTHT